MCLKFAETCLKIDNMKQLLVSKCPMLTRNKCCCFIDWNFSGANAPPCSSWDTGRILPFVWLVLWRTILIIITHTSVSLLIKTLVTHGWNTCATEPYHISP